jgi:hypothetical protein
MRPRLRTKRWLDLLERALALPWDSRSARECRQGIEDPKPAQRDLIASTRTSARAARSESPRAGLPTRQFAPGVELDPDRRDRGLARPSVPAYGDWNPEARASCAHTGSAVHGLSGCGCIARACPRRRLSAQCSRISSDFRAPTSRSRSRTSFAAAATPSGWSTSPLAGVRPQAGVSLEPRNPCLRKSSANTLTVCRT